MTSPINLTAGLKDVSRKGKTGEKMAIQIESDDLIFDPDDKAMAAAVAAAMVEECKRQLLAGRRPDGTALPGLKPATSKRREDEVAQGSRGGEAHPRYKDAKFRARVKKNYDRDYTLSRGGKAFTPEEVAGPRGVVSGMLVESFFARPNRDGRGVTIYVAAKRGRPRKGETLSALQTVYGEGGSLLSKALMTSRSVQKAIGDALAASFLGKNGNRLVKSVLDAVEALNEVGESAADAATAGE